MQPKIHPSRNRSGASIAAPAVEIENVQMVLDLTKPISARASADRGKASLRIRAVRELLADLLLEDDLEHENGLLLSTVAVDLSEMILELDRLSGLQCLFEFWVQDEKLQDEG